MEGSRCGQKVKFLKLDWPVISGLLGVSNIVSRVSEALLGTFPEVSKYLLIPGKALTADQCTVPPESSLVNQ